MLLLLVDFFYWAGQLVLNSPGRLADGLRDGLLIVLASVLKVRVSSRVYLPELRRGCVCVSELV